jgi:hypothetical protein
MDSFSPMIKAIESYFWLIFFTIIVFVFQKPIIKFFRNVKSRKKDSNKKDDK